MGKRTRRTFESWWDPERYNWKDASELLPIHYKNKFHTWWNPEKFNWKRATSMLIMYCSEYFDIWWPHRRFDVRDCLVYLFEYCLDRTDVWGVALVAEDPTFNKLAHCVIRNFAKVCKLLLSDVLTA